MTIVVDASIVVELLLARIPVQWQSVFDGDVAAPDLVFPEVVSTLRRMLHQGILDAASASVLLDALLDMPIEIVSSRELIQRAFDFNDRVTVYDGCYVALAESLDATLLTADRRLARTHDLPVTVEML